MYKSVFNVGEGVEIESSVTGGVLYTQNLNGDLDPTTGAGVDAPISSSYTRAVPVGDGSFTITVYDKIGPATTAWVARLSSSVTGDVGTIGTPTDGVYTDGLFPFVPATTVANAVDTVNEFLALMAPPAAPALTNLESALTGATGKLSFDTTHTISGYSYDATTINTQVSKTGNDLGIFNGSTAITGILNNNVAVSSVGSYLAKAFSNGNEGTLELWVNGTKVHESDLSAVGAGTFTTSGSGFVLTASAACKFSNNNPFPALQYRTGTLTIAAAHQVGGYNYAEVRHVLPSGTQTSNQFFWYNSVNATAVTATSLTLTPIMTTTRYVSGVRYYQAGSIQLQGTVNNAYADVYSASASAVSAASAQATMPSAALPTTTVNTATYAANLQATLSTSLRLLGAAASSTLSVLHPVKSTYTSSSTASSLILYDPIVSVSALVEDFNIETYRTSGVPANAYTAYTAYDSAASIASGVELQYFNGTLKYPAGDYRASSEGGVIAYAPTGNPNYAGATGTRSMIRAFQNTSGSTKANFKLNITGGTTTFVAAGSLSGNNLSVEMKFPVGTLAAGTGWLDAYKDFATGQWTDGSGCRAGSFGNGRALATDWGITLGTQSIAANEWVYVRITAPSSWAGYLDSTTFTWL